MAERHLLCLNTLYSPHHEPGVLFDVEAIVLRVPSAETRASALDLNGFQVSAAPALVEVVYPRDLAGFDSVSRAVAYNEKVLAPRSLARGDTLVLLAEQSLRFACGVRLLHLSAEGARVWENAPASAIPPRMVWSPGAPLTGAEHERLQWEILYWSRPRPVGGASGS